MNEEPQSEYEFLPLDDLLSQRKDLYDEKKSIEEGELKKINKDLKSLDGFIIRRMQDNGIQQCRGNDGRATFSISEEVVPEIVDWDSLYTFIAENKYFHLLYRKVTARSFRELIENGVEVPGAEPKKRTTLRMRSN